MTSGRHQNELLLEMFCRLQVEVSELMTAGGISTTGGVLMTGGEVVSMAGGKVVSMAGGGV